MVDRVSWFVGHHHTYTDIDDDDPDYQILMEADYIAKVSGNGWNRKTIVNFRGRIMKTASCGEIRDDVFCMEGGAEHGL